MNDARDDAAGKWARLTGRVLCALGFHRFRILEVRFGFGAGNHIEKIECRRCGLVTTRRT